MSVVDFFCEIEHQVMTVEPDPEGNLLYTLPRLVTSELISGLEDILSDEEQSSEGALFDTLERNLRIKQVLFEINRSLPELLERLDLHRVAACLYWDPLSGFRLHISLKDKASLLDPVPTIH